MTSINDKLGMKRAGKRNMMKLPTDRAARASLTSAVCPACGRRGVMAYKTRGRLMRACTYCYHEWEPTP